MIKEGDKYSRCKSISQTGRSTCLEHNPSLELSGTHKTNSSVARGGTRIWIPGPLPIEEKKPAIRSECCAIKFGPNGTVIKCSNKATPKSREGKYCSAHKHAYRLEFDECCAICIEPNDQTKHVPLQCGHLFHTECLCKWNKNTCPKCRAKMNADETAKYTVSSILNNEAVRHILDLGSRLTYEIADHILHLSIQNQNPEIEVALVTLIRNWRLLASMIPASQSEIYNTLLESTIASNEGIQDLVMRTL